MPLRNHRRSVAAIRFHHSQQLFFSRLNKLLILENPNEIIKILLNDYEINKIISTLSAGRFELKEATHYTAFKRLEESGYITSYWGDSGAGARRRYYTITPSGREACHRLLDEWAETKEIMDKLLHVEERK